MANVVIYSNDGNTQLAFYSFMMGLPNITDFTSAGCLFSDGDDDEYFTYSGTGTFIGFATTANASTPVLSVGNDYNGVGGELYVVEQTTETYKYLTYTSKKVQVESAIRDEDGVRIKTNYALKSEVPNITISSSDPTGGSNGDIWIKY